MSTSFNVAGPIMRDEHAAADAALKLCSFVTERTIKKGRRTEVATNYWSPPKLPTSDYDTEFAAGQSYAIELLEVMCRHPSCARSALSRVRSAMQEYENAHPRAGGLVRIAFREILDDVLLFGLERMDLGRLKSNLAKQHEEWQQQSERRAEKAKPA